MPKHLNILSIWPDLKKAFLSLMFTSTSSAKLYPEMKQHEIPYNQSWVTAEEHAQGYGCQPLCLLQSQVNNRQPHSARSADHRGCCYIIWTVTTSCETQGQIIQNWVKDGIKQTFFFYYNLWILLSFYDNY